MAAPRERRNSNSQLLLELDSLSQTLFQSSTRRTNSLALPRSSAPILTPNVPDASSVSKQKPRSRRMSMSPFRSRTKSQIEFNEYDDEEEVKNLSTSHSTAAVLAGSEKQQSKGIWGWKPLRALAHIRMNKIGCLFSVEVVCVQRLPASMNGLRMSVAVRKKDTKDGAVQTMPARVSQGCADFEETLFIKCHVYFSGKPPKFEPHPFLINAVAIDAPELNFGRNSVDLSVMVKESMERSLEGERVRQWDATFNLDGKAKGGELVVKLGFQIMEDGGFEIYKKSDASSSGGLARNQTKNSFSVSSPKVTRKESPIKEMEGVDLKDIDDFKLDEPAPATLPPPEQKQDDLDFPEFEVIEKGIELQEGAKEEKVKEEENDKVKEEEVNEEEAESESNADVASFTSEVVKEVVHDGVHQTRLTELEAIAQQIKALESMVNLDDGNINQEEKEEEQESQKLDEDEETVTREFLQMLELDDEKDYSITFATTAEEKKSENIDAKCYLSDLGKGLGAIVQTRDGGYLVAMNPFDTEVTKKDLPKLVMQVSKSILIKDQGTGIEILQRLAALGPEELDSKLAMFASMDELMNKTAEQIAFEGIASAIISGRNKEGASSTAAKSVATLKTMASAMTEGREQRILTGIWNVKEEPLALEEVLPFSLQKVEAMAIQALKVQAEVYDEEAPFDISPLVGEENPLDSIVQPEDIEKLTKITMLVVIQMRDPIRRYDTVGAPMIALIQATKVEDLMFKVMNMHVAGVKVKSREKERLKAAQWLVAYGLGKSKKKRGKKKEEGKGDEFLWSISSRIMADMWMNAMRNPNVKFAEKQ